MVKKVLLIIFIIAVIIGIAGGTLSFIFNKNQNQSIAPNNQTNNFSPSAQTDQEKVIITIKDSSFQPDNLTIKKGTTVVWVNEEDALHHIINTPNGDIFESNDLKKGESYSFTFNESGNYDYYCKINPVMAGKIVVIEE